MPRPPTLPALFAAALLLAASALGAQPLEISPPNPRPGETIEITYQVLGCGAGIPIFQVRPPGAGNGRILLDATTGVLCPEPVAVPVTATLALPLGTYSVLAFAAGAPATGAVVVSRTGAVATLAVEPSVPVAGEITMVTVGSVCPFTLEGVRVTPGADRGLIEVDLWPGGPCGTEPMFGQTMPLPLLAPGGYLLRVVTPDGATEAELAFGVAAPGGMRLLGDRFAVSAEWSAPGLPKGTAFGVPLTGESGSFHFGNPENVELLVKTLDGCPVNERAWVFIAGLTNLAVTVWVQDTATGQVERYANPFGRAFPPVQDTSSFESCDLFGVVSSGSP